MAAITVGRRPCNMKGSHAGPEQMLRGSLGLKLDWSRFNKAGSAGNICGKQCKQNSQEPSETSAANPETLVRVWERREAETSERMLLFQIPSHDSHLRSALSFPSPLLLRLAAGLLLLARNLHDSVLKTAASVFPLCYPITAFQSQDGRGGANAPPTSVCRH